MKAFLGKENVKICYFSTLTLLNYEAVFSAHSQICPVIILAMCHHTDIGTNAFSSSFLVSSGYLSSEIWVVIGRVGTDVGTVAVLGVGD